MDVCAIFSVQHTQSISESYHIYQGVNILTILMLFILVLVNEYSCYANLRGWVDIF